ncbi:MAG: GyrI-like domain-containing protein [Saprospiraceae bacterium]|nr:GyrI-like domain-containing protein [Saprospiraceae bacterium]
MEKLDFKKEFKRFYNPSAKEPEIVEVPEWQFLMIDGKDARPESKDFQEAIQALFSVSYKTKFAIKKSQNIDYGVMPLEGLWWSDDMDDFINGNKANWQWTLMIMQPNFVTQDDINDAIQTASKKEPTEALNHLRLEKFKEGLSAQIMHIGPFSEEHDNIMKLHDLIKSQGGHFDRQAHIYKHHEIYLSDFRRTAPEKLKTVIRQPFRK